MVEIYAQDVVNNTVNMFVAIIIPRLTLCLHKLLYGVRISIYVEKVKTLSGFECSSENDQIHFRGIFFSRELCRKNYLRDCRVYGIIE